MPRNYHEEHLRDAERNKRLVFKVDRELWEKLTREQQWFIMRKAKDTITDSMAVVLYKEEGG
jgi:hypothetical protein